MLKKSVEDAIESAEGKRNINGVGVMVCALSRASFSALNHLIAKTVSRMTLDRTISYIQILRKTHPAMDRLPQELVTYIASFVDREDAQSDEKTASQLPAYATLSRKWQLAVESRTFRSLRLKSPELPYFARVLTDHRRNLLSNLAYDAVLPTYTDNECAKFETKEDMERNSQAFTYAVHALFQILKSWEVGNAETKCRELFLYLSDIYSPMDRFHRDMAKYEEDRELYESDKRSDLWEHRYEHSILQLLEHPKLPTLSCVSSFRLSFIAHRHVEPRSAILLARKLLNLQSITIELHDNEKKHPHIRQQLRHGMINTPSSVVLDSSVINLY